ncbi:hypothetical protein [Treponema bryantii]|uniref:hypothetical protein n=1 Tax=Treponema bryantii TaxID=163 RepID=UPI002B2E1C07|nr:hypothetical protein TRBR_29280 [Treponema bryantii]
MAAVFNPSMIMTNDFYQENYSDDKSPSSREIEHVLGEKMDPDLANMIDSMTGKEAGELLVKLLEP